jgi:hypothetical protein
MSKQRIDVLLFSNKRKMKKGRACTFEKVYERVMNSILLSIHFQITQTVLMLNCPLSFHFHQKTKCYCKVESLQVFIHIFGDLTIFYHHMFGCEHSRAYVEAQ